MQSAQYLHAKMRLFDMKIEEGNAIFKDKNETRWSLIAEML